jgi:guanylate kinase
MKNSKPETNPILIHLKPETKQRLKIQSTREGTSTKEFIQNKLDEIAKSIKP